MDTAEANRKQSFEEWKLLSEHHQRASDTVDKTLITVAAGALIASISLLQVFGTSPVYVSLLFGGWISFTLALLLMLFGIRIGLKAFEMEAQSSLDYLLNQDVVRRAENKFTPWVHRIYTASTFLVGIGLILFVIFTISNFPMSEKIVSGKLSESAPLPGLNKVMNVTPSEKLAAPLQATIPKQTVSPAAPVAPSPSTPVATLKPPAASTGASGAATTGSGK